ncbi:MAG TPA: biopolymer transporter ExbD [candidate division Zixibacteria bacterium]|nr:biopolymer transporter ExbD [candidate division Zixibacteria bacterium]
MAVGFKQKSKLSSEIPNSSLADIVFLLLIFFMTVTVFKEYQGLRVQLPMAKATQKIEARRDISYIWLDRENRLNIDDVLLSMPEVRPIMAEKMRENPALIVSIRADERAKYGNVALLMEALKEANALRINFATISES